MKIVDLVAKVKTLSMEEIDELVDNGIEIENIPYLLSAGNQDFKHILFRNEKLKQYILKELNSCALEFFESVNNDPSWSKLPDVVEKIGGTYLRDYFKEGMELEIGSEIGRKIVSMVRDLKNKNTIFSKLYKDEKVWNKYSDVIRDKTNKDFFSIPKSEAFEYNKTFAQYFNISVVGSNVPEAEASLKITQRDDVDLQRIMGLDFLVLQYGKQKNNETIQNEDEVISILLEYEVQLKNKGIEKEIVQKYSLINTIEQQLRSGEFGKDNTLSKKEFAMALRMLQNPEILNSDANQKLSEVLGQENLQLNIGRREINALLEDKEMFEQICEIFPSLRDGILKQIDADIYSILKNISERQRQITSEEMKKYSQYLSDYFELSLENNFDTPEMTQLFSLVLDLGYPELVYNIQELKGQEDTLEFFKREIEEKKVFERYDSKVVEIIAKLQSGDAITEQEFKRYDEVFYEYSYITVLDNSDNIKMIQALEKKSKDLQVPSLTIENQIEQYIDQCIKGEGNFEHEEFYQTILEYYRTQLKGSAIDINQNASISHLIFAAQNGNIPQDIATIFLDQLQERKKKSESVKIPDTQDLEEYMNAVAEIRLQQGRMPRECSEFIIRQSILRKQDMSKYKGMIERALEDISQYELEKSQISEYYVAVADQQFIGKETNGKHNGSYKRIFLSRETIQSEGTFKILETILHEHTHAEQEAQINDAQLNGNTYKMLKELILRKNDNSFYNVNYDYMYNEIDARTKGYMKRLKLLKEIGLSDDEIAILQGANVQEKVRKYSEEYEKGKVKKSGQEIKEVNIIFIELLQKNPELLNAYPVLEMEFEIQEDNIQRKTFASILEEYEQMLGLAENQKEVERISSLCNEILLNGGAIPEEKIQEELKQLIAYKSENPIINAYKNKILKTKFSSQMVMEATMKSMYENHSQKERDEIQQQLKKAFQTKKQVDIIQEPENDCERG